MSRGAVAVALTLAVLGAAAVMGGCSLIDLASEYAYELLDQVETEIERAEPEDPEAETDEPEEEAEEVAEEDEPELEIDEWKNPTEIQEIMATFQHLEWSWTDIRGEDERTHVVIYTYEGTEQVGDVQTEKATIDLDGDQLVVWIDADGNKVQGEMDGETLPEEIAETMLSGLMASAFLPFLTVESYNLPEMVSDGGYGWEWEVTETSRENFGGLQADVTRAQFTLGPPLVEEEHASTVLWGIGDFGDFHMVVEWRGDEAEGEHGFRMQVIDVALR